jgi:hypothetical protein
VLKLSCWKHDVCLTARDTPSSTIQHSVRQVADRCTRQRPRRFQPKHWHWSGHDDHVRGQCEGYSVPRGDLQTLNTLSHAKYALSLPRKLWTKSSSAVYVSSH